MRIVVTGASGLIGRALIPKLILAGHEVRALVRSPAKFHDLPASCVYPWKNANELPPTNVFRDMDAVIHLAGEPVAARWNAAVKARIRSSRVEGTENLVKALAAIPEMRRPKILLSGSAIGYYGNSGDVVLTESAKVGTDFLAEVTRDWEAAAFAAQALGIRTVFLRTGIVLAREGGALSKMAPIVLGNGRQWMSWIHIEDELRLIEFALEHEKISGPMNLAAPEPVTNREFTKAFATAVKLPYLGLSVPSLALRLVAGEMAGVISASQRVSPERATKLGFRFKFPSLQAALKDLYGDDNFLDSRLTATQLVPRPLNEVFEFFSRAENLEEITPKFLSFKIKKVSTEKMAAGTLIDYRLKIHGIPVGWRTRIEKWVPGKEFVDVQLKGPYSKWHHRHTFAEVADGTLVTDQITYRVPFWFLGKTLLGSWIRKDVDSIFHHRGETIGKLFGGANK